LKQNYSYGKVKNMPRKKLTPLHLHKQIKMVLKNFTYEEVRAGLEDFSPEEWWDIRDKLQTRLPEMNLEQLSLYDFKQLTYRMYGVVPEYDILETVH
jgi:hypothetical protein